MVTRHQVAARQQRSDLAIDLIVGMTGVDGLPIGTHLGFQSIADRTAQGAFACSYITAGESVHSKLYVWLSEDRPIEAWVGSANYTQNGFGLGGRDSHHSEVMTRTSPEESLDYFLAAASRSVHCNAPDIEDRIELLAPIESERHRVFSTVDMQKDLHDHLESCVLPLFMTSGPRRGQVHGSSGLNWGQRVVDGRSRNRNQAYIPIPSRIAQAGFFPPRGVHFNLATTDGESMLMTVAQDGDKALESTQSNAIIGLYFRQRLGIASGEKVTIEDLDRFGNRYVTIYKVNADEYILDFSPAI